MLHIALIHRKVHSFILYLQAASVPSKPFPRDIMNWSETFFAPVFKTLMPAADTSVEGGENVQVLAYNW